MAPPYNYNFSSEVDSSSGQIQRSSSFIVSSDTNETFVVDIPIGHGAFGSVRKFKSENGGQLAVKNFGINAPPKGFHSAQWEYDHMKIVYENREDIQLFFDANKSPRLMMPFHEMESLAELFDSKKIDRVSAIKILGLAAKAALIIYEHTGVLHMDLNQKNILVLHELTDDVDLLG